MSNGVLIAECTMQKFNRAYAFENDTVPTPISLNASINVGFDGTGETLNWDTLRDNMFSPDEEEEEIIKVEALPDAPEWSEIIDLIPDYRKYAFEVIMSVMASRKNIENPAWLGIVAPPSTGKTFMLKMFDHTSVAMLIDDFTDNALAAGTPNTDAAEVHSMLDDATGINLVMNDMSSVFSQRPEKVQKFIGSLTTAYGGTFVKYSPGTGAQRHASATSVIMGMTNRTYKKHRKYMSMLGNRFLFLTLKRPARLRHREDTRTYDLNDLRLKVCAFQQDIISKTQPTLSDAVDDYLYEFVHKVIVMRNIRWITCWDELEGESRLYQEMIELCMTRAKIQGRDEVLEEDVDFFKPLAFETIPNVKNIKTIQNLIAPTTNNKWTKYILKNAIKLGLTEFIEQDVEVNGGIRGTRMETLKMYTWNADYTEFVDELIEISLYHDDGDENDE